MWSALILICTSSHFLHGTNCNLKSDIYSSASCPANPTCEPRRQHYRSEDGSCNNLDNPTWGQSGLPYIRVLERQHSLVDCGRASHLPNPRLVSGTLIRRGEEDYSEQASIMVMIYGQVIDESFALDFLCHDLGGSDALNLDLLPDDRKSKIIPFR